MVSCNSMLNVSKFHTQFTIYDIQISVATFHLGGFALAQQSHGRDSAIKIQGASFSSEECPAISWEDFQVRFPNNTPYWFGHL